MVSRLRTIALVVSSVLVLAACGLAADEKTTASESGNGYPVTVENCGADVEFAAAPQKLVLLKSSSVPYLDELDVMDRIVARAGDYPRDYYDEETWAALEAVPSLTGKMDTTGHLQISKEVVMDKEPDLVFGEVDNLSRETLAGVDVALLEEPALCEVGTDNPGFEDVYSQLEMYGKVFDRNEEASAAVADIKRRVEELSVDEDATRRTAAVLYPTVGGGVTYTYGSKSMVTPVLEAAGLDNVFADTDERVFEVSIEELLGRDPEVLVLLHGSGDPDKVIKAVTSLSGAEDLTAVRNNDMMTLLFNYMEPATPLSVDGLEKIRQEFGDGS